MMTGMAPFEDEPFTDKGGTDMLLLGRATLVEIMVVVVVSREGSLEKEGGRGQFALRTRPESDGCMSDSFQPPCRCGCLTRREAGLHNKKGPLSIAGGTRETAREKEL
jgi:hypothetical protein